MAFLATQVKTGPGDLQEATAATAHTETLAAEERTVTPATQEDLGFLVLKVKRESRPTWTSVDRVELWVLVFQADLVIVVQWVQTGPQVEGEPEAPMVTRVFLGHPDRQAPQVVKA